MSTEMKRAVAAAAMQAQYDRQAKRLLGHKSILARILVKTVDEFKGMNPREVERCIEGEPLIGVVPVEPGLTNRVIMSASGKRIMGLNTENAEINEGAVYFDILFYVRTKDGLSRIIINVEEQKDEPDLYEILNRAIFYGGRLLSSQKEREFEGSNYNDIKKVYTIWICMNAKECIWNHIRLTNEKVLGDHEWKGNIDLLNIVLIGLPRELPKKGEEYELHRLLTALLSVTLPIRERLEIIQKEYRIPLENESEKEAESMCNLGQGVLEYGIELGMERGMERGMEHGMMQCVSLLYQSGMLAEEIARRMKMSVEKVKEALGETS